MTDLIDLMKIFTFHLPQYHTIPENDKWWGKGFTEWTSVKSGKPMFDGHEQPVVPLNKNYYDLSKTEALKEQSTLAKKYGISGFCFYYYYFDGKILLEKPLENFLNDKSIDIEFCFSWPSVSWSRTWSAWSGDNREVLIKQNYADGENWDNHFNFLIKFFKDDRYLKIDNKPVYILYGTSDIPDLKNFLDYFNNLAKKEGFDGLYFVKIQIDQEEIETRYDFDAYLEFEPSLTMSNQTSKLIKIKRFLKIDDNTKSVSKIYAKLFDLLVRVYRKYKELQPVEEKVFVLDYDKLCKEITNRELKPKTWLGMFPAWDNSPRKSKRATIVTGSTPEKFKKYLSKQIKRSHESGSEFLFINAWNEWSEGAYLEPDEKNKYGYLEAVKGALEENNLL